MNKVEPFRSLFEDAAFRRAEKVRAEIHMSPDVAKAHDDLKKSYVSNDESVRDRAREAYKKAFEAHPKHAEYKKHVSAAKK